MGPETLEWTPDLETGVADVDDAHCELLGLYNRIVFACEKDGAVGTFRERMRTFLIYARWHFAEEEALMRRLHYPDYMDHKGHHQRLLQDAEDFLESFGDSLRLEDNSAIASYLMHWLTRHLNDKDGSLRNFLITKNTASTLASVRN